MEGKMKKVAWLFVLVMSLYAAGCNRSADELVESFKPVDEDTTNQPQSAQTVAPSKSYGENPATMENQVPLHADPGAVVSAFLESLRNADSNTAENLLTDRARFETKKAKLEVRPPGSPDAKFFIGQKRYANSLKELVHVDSLWAERNENGEEESYTITWVLRLQSNGSWRVAGMLTAPAVDERPIYLDFENPLEMMAKAESIQSGSTSGIEDQGVRQASFEDENGQADYK
jgi:hypothetical protein